LIVAALDAGAGTIVVGAGGSATNDGGSGMASALGVRFLDAEGSELPLGGAALARLETIDIDGMDARLRETKVTAATDVTNPLCGPEGASLVYGAQKGASAEDAVALDDALRRYAETVERRLGVRIVDVPGAGAAGGLGAGLIAFAGAEVRPGFEIVANITGLRGRIASADVVITGEGRLDGQTAYGKTVAGVAALAKEVDVPVIAIPGSLGDGWEDMKASLDTILPVTQTGAGSAVDLATASEKAVLERARKSTGR
jgi:glycerate kinase